MVTVANIVEKIISQRPFIQEALGNGIINNAALAEQILPEVEKEMKQKVKFSAVNMSIRRFSDKLEKSHMTNVKFNKGSHLSVRSNIMALTLYKSNQIQNKIQELYEYVDYKKGDYLVINRGLHEIMVMIDSKYKDYLLKLFKKSEIRLIFEDLSSVSITIPEEAIETPGLFYIVTRALVWNNINIIEIVSTLTEMTFILREDDTPNAYKTLKDLINSNQ